MKIASVVFAPSICFGLAIALAGCILTSIPSVAEFEQDWGLAWMFYLRGARPAPADVAIVSIDNESVRDLGLDNGINQWPRHLHTQLLRKLKDFGARVIAFDVFFKLPRDSRSDREFATELSRAGNVVLFAQLNQYPVEIADPRGATTTILTEELVPPIDLFTKSALGYAPFPLPKVPARVNQAWLFKSGSGEVPTLPVLALHRFALPAFIDLQRELADTDLFRDSDGVTGRSGPGSSPNRLSAIVRRTRQTAIDHPEIIRNLQPDRMHPALKALYQGPNSVYINFYGPPQTIETIPYSQVIYAKDGQSNSFGGFDFKDKAVFVGNSEKFQPDLKDDFHTVFSQDAGFDLSGVEIMATVFANLLEGEYIRPLAHYYNLGLIALWGLLIGLLFSLAPGFRWTAGAMVISASSYLILATIGFKQHGLWIPLVNPLLIQLPLAFSAAMLMKYRATHRKSRRIQQTAGFFLPREVVESLADWKREELGDAGRIVEGVCLASDAENFASFAEKFEPHELKHHLNCYYGLLFQPIRNRGGRILDVVGDAMLAFWENNPHPGHSSLQACAAAMEIQGKTKPGAANLEVNILPTRIGLHAGKMVVGHVGAGDHFEFRAVGDMINTTSRIEALNKQLGTRVLASSLVADALEGFVTRRVGKFRLKGKENHLEIFELVGRPENCDQEFLDKRQIFLDGLAEYEAGRWREAKLVFDAIIQDYGDDGPSQFFRLVCDEYLRNGTPKDWDGVYTLKVK
ncbi:MAG: CHASE2 domain-containing protein [Methylococcales bacterium]